MSRNQQRFVDTLIGADRLRHTPVLRLFGDPYVTHGSRRRSVPDGTKRVLVFAALRCGPVDRRFAAGMLWPAVHDDRAAGNLRSALWRLNRAGIDLLVADKTSVALRPDVIVDAHVVDEWAARMVAGRPLPTDLAELPTSIGDLDLLPGWYDEWVSGEQQRLRQRTLHALEAMSRHLVGARRYPEAVEVAMAAVAAEPLRESAQTVLIEAHVAAGNRVAGRRAFRTYRQLLSCELGVEPSPRLAAMA